jgi:hypothetical protein
MAFGGGVWRPTCRRLLADHEDRAHYDWMGYIAMALGGVRFLAIRRLLATREVCAYRQQMGITLMGDSGLAFMLSHHDRHPLLSTNIILAGAWSDAVLRNINATLYLVPFSVGYGVHHPHRSS